jgi:hypothetical protein
MINKAFYLVKLVVRGGVGPSTFAFQVWEKARLPAALADRPPLDVRKGG